MKFTKVLISILTVTLLSAVTYAQLPKAINFQGVATKDGTVLKEKSIGLKLSIIDSAQGGKVVYRGFYGRKTNEFGSFQLQVGKHDYRIGSAKFSDINWQTGKKHMNISFSEEPDQSDSIDLGTIEMVTVPFAFAAESVTNIHDQNVKKGDMLVFDGSNWVPQDTVITLSKRFVVNTNSGLQSKSAALQVNADDKGVLISRVRLDSAHTAHPIVNPAKGLLVFNHGGKEEDGFWYWEGTRWTRLLTTPSSSANSGIAILYGEKAQDNQAGTFTSGGWRQREISTHVGDHSFVTLNNNTFTLNPGVYLIEAWVSAYQVGSHQVALYNSQTNTFLRSGSTEKSAPGAAIQTKSEVIYLAEIDDKTSYEIMHQCTTSQSANGFGTDAGFATERYLQIKITKLN